MTDKEKIEEALKIIDSVLESADTRLKELRVVEKNDIIRMENSLSIQFFETTKQLLGNLKRTLT